MDLKKISLKFIECIPDAEPYIVDTMVDMYNRCWVDTTSQEDRHVNWSNSKERYFAALRNVESSSELALVAGAFDAAVANIARREDRNS